MLLATANEPPTRAKTTDGTGGIETAFTREESKGITQTTRGIA